MNAVETVASHRLTFNGQDEVVDADTGLPFDTDSYSSMKYGNREVTRRFARELTGHVLEVRPELLEDESAPAFLVPFSVVPPTPFHLSR